MSPTTVKQGEKTYFRIYLFSWFVVLLIGLLGLFVVAVLTVLSGIDLKSLLGNVTADAKLITEVLITLIALVIACIVIGWIQVALIAIIGRLLILAVMWLTPFALMGISILIFISTHNANSLGGVVIGVVVLGLVFLFRKSIALSARFVQMGARVSTKNPSMFFPQLVAVILIFIATIFMIGGSILLFLVGGKIHPIVGVVLVIIYFIFYYFVVNVINAFANAHNLAYADQWYSGKPSSREARALTKSLRGPITRFAFLMSFFSWFYRSRSSSFNPLSLFKYINFSTWIQLGKSYLFGGGPVRTASKVVAYLGSYTLVLIIANKLTSVTQAFKESMGTVFHTFSTNIAGNIGLNIVEMFRKWVSIILLLATGAIYGFAILSGPSAADIDRFITALIMAILFLLLGYIPLSAMFRPVTNTYQMVLYRSYTGKSSSKVDKNTQKLIREVFKK